jgi:hypothetical protein
MYESKDRKEEKVFGALEWLAAITSHVPNKREQMVGYYSHYSNAFRGLLQNKNFDDLIPSILDRPSNPLGLPVGHTYLFPCLL